MAEAFLIAFSLPNMFRRFFAEGAFNMAFVPMFAKKLEAGEDAQGFARDAFNGLAAVLIVFTMIGTIAMPLAGLGDGIAALSGDERFDLAVMFGRITFPYILFISLVALLSGVLNAFGRFTEAGFVPVLMNLMFIAAMLLADRLGWDMGLTLAWTVPITGIAQLAFTWYCGPPRRVPLPLRLAAPDAGPEAAGDHRRAGGAGGRRGADQPAGRPSGRLVHRRRGRLAVLCRPAVSAAARASSASPSAPCCCPTCRAACARATCEGGRDSLQPGRRIRAGC